MILRAWNYFLIFNSPRITGIIFKIFAKGNWGAVSFSIMVYAENNNGIFVDGFPS